MSIVNQHWKLGLPYFRAYGSQFPFSILRIYSQCSRVSYHIFDWYFIVLGCKQRAVVTGKNVEEVGEDEPPANQKTLGDAEPDSSLGSNSGERIFVPIWSCLLVSFE